MVQETSPIPAPVNPPPDSHLETSSDSELAIPARVNTARRTLYLHHEAVVESLAGKDDQFRQAAAQAVTSARTAQRAEHALSKIHDAKTQLTQQLEQFQSRKFRNKLFKKKAATTQGKLQTNIQAVSEDAAVAQKHAKMTQHTADADAKHCEELRPDAETLIASEKERRHILEDVFGGMDVGSPTENSIESERNRLAKVTDRAKDKLSTQKQAYLLLRQAAVELSNARKNLWDAQLTNTVDIFAGGGVGFVAGLGSQYNINQAAKQAQNAGQKIQAAVELNPRLPIRKLAKVQNGVVIGFADIFLDGFVTDLLIRYTIEKAVKSVEAVTEALKESLEIQKSIVVKLDGRVRSYSDDLKRTSEDLVRVRADLLHSIHK